MPDMPPPDLAAYDQSLASASATLDTLVTGYQRMRTTSADHRTMTGVAAHLREIGPGATLGLCLAAIRRLATPPEQLPVLDGPEEGTPAARIAKTRETYLALAADSWDRFDVVTAVKYRGYAEGLRMAGAYLAGEDV